MLESSSLPENPVAGDPYAGPGHRWPRKETVALLEIRSSMDATFRDSSAKAPLWEEVSRKMGELGFSRSGKKCKEKFENIYKYHKRTRDGRSGKATGKAYRFFEQLEALDHHSFDHPLHSLGDVRLETSPSNNVILSAVPCSVHKPVANTIDAASTPSTSSSSSTESEGTRKKKRKVSHFFERLMKEVVERQERLQRMFIEALEKCERDRIAREEAWKAQETARMKRETELVVKERSIAAAKDAAVLAFLKKFAEQSEGVEFPETLFPDSENEAAKLEKSEKVCLGSQEKYDDRSFAQMGSSRWPKEEVDALIRLRTSLEEKYQDNAPKGPLWEEISASMVNLGFKRSARRCKEKWENINKYFKRVKEGNKRRYVHSRTCPYFDQLDALYSKKTKNNTESSIDSDLRPEELLMHMMGGQQEEQARTERVATEDGKTENIGDDDDDDDDDQDGSFEIGNEQVGAENSASQRASLDKAASVEVMG